jgi:hypothetical protein
MKVCSRCGEEKSDSDFYRKASSEDGLRGQCKKCESAVRGLKTLRDGATPAQRVRRREKLAVLRAYGGDPPKCSCCGEDKYEFLVIDHVNGGGTQHRSEVCRTAREFYGWLIRSGFPSGLRVLCHNCNAALGLYGYCPHNQPGLTPLTIDPERGPSGTKKCPRCKEWRPFDRFGIDRTEKDGLRGYCRPCAVDVNREYRERKKARR